MQSPRWKTLLLFASIALGACGKSAGGGGSGDFDAFMKLETEKAAAFSAGGADCVAKAKSVGDWRTKNTANYNAMRDKLNQQWPKGPPDDLKAKYGPQMAAGKKAVMDAMMACTGNEAFDKMMDDTKGL